MATRKEVREKLVTLLTATGSFTTVNGFMPLDLKGTNKVLNIYARTSHLDRPSKDDKYCIDLFNLDVLVKRDGDVGDEDDSDTLYDAVVQVVIANTSNDVWSHIQLEENTERSTVEVAGVPYRLERHAVQITRRL